MNIFNLEGLYDLREIRKRIITTGELNNLLGDNIAILKVIGIKKEYNYPAITSTNRDEVREIFRELDIEDSETAKNLEAENTILIKVISDVMGFHTDSYYLKIVETVRFQDRWTHFNTYERIMKYNKRTRNINSTKNHNYCIDGTKKGVPSNKFDDLLGLEFLVTGLGIKIDERANSLDNLIMLDGVLLDYK